MKKKINDLLMIYMSGNLSIWWNIGFFLFIVLFIQIFTGMLMSLNYFNMENLFFSVIYLSLNLNYGWVIHLIHSNNTSLLFIFIYMHLLRGLMFNSLKMFNMWISGLMLMMMVMMISFLGYILIQSQMSYWGLMVITSFLMMIYYINNLAIFFWGNYMINKLTFNRVFVIHFIMPFLVFSMMILHLMILHSLNSSNLLGLKMFMDMIKLNYYLVKDLYMIIIIMVLMWIYMMIFPFKLNNSDNFIYMNVLLTPVNIEPEWYFMMFYSILRSISNKLSGLMIMMMSMFMLMYYFFINKQKFQILKFYPMNKIFLYCLIFILLNLMITGFKVIEYPYLFFNYIIIINYYLMLYLYLFIMLYWDLMI